MCDQTKNGHGTSQIHLRFEPLVSCYAAQTSEMKIMVI